MASSIHLQSAAVPRGASEEAAAPSWPAYAVIAHATWKVTGVHSSLQLFRRTLVAQAPFSQLQEEQSAASKVRLHRSCVSLYARSVHFRSMWGFYLPVIVWLCVFRMTAVFSQCSAPELDHHTACLLVWQSVWLHKFFFFVTDNLVLKTRVRLIWSSRNICVCSIISLSVYH